MRILISGASGFIGTALVPYLEGGGHIVTRLVRRPPRGPRERTWDPSVGVLDTGLVEAADAVINLSGEDLSAGRWTAERKRRIWDSRVHSTNLLASGIALASPRPQVMINASGVGFYGDRGEELLTEDSAPGSGFLPRLAQEWEHAAEPARAAGARVVSLRNGMVLAAHGGALAKLLGPFRYGAGGPFGNGRAWWTWIALEDVQAATRFALENSALSGPVNLVAPDPVRNAEFARALARVLHRPAVVPAPAFALRALLGEMANAALLASTRAVPRRLLDAGFRHRFPELEDALRDALGRPARAAA